MEDQCENPLSTLFAAATPARQKKSSTTPSTNLLRMSAGGKKKTVKPTPALLAQELKAAWKWHLVNRRSDQTAWQIVELLKGRIRAVTLSRSREFPSGIPTNDDDYFQTGMIAAFEAVFTFNEDLGDLEPHIMRRVYHSASTEVRKLDWVPKSVRIKEKNGELKAASMTSASFRCDARTISFAEMFATDRIQESQADIEDWWKDSMKGLSQRERLVLVMHYRCDATFEEISKHLGVVESRVSQLHSSALKRLADRFNE